MTVEIVGDALVEMRMRGTVFLGDIETSRDSIHRLKHFYRRAPDLFTNVSLHLLLRFVKTHIKVGRYFLLRFIKTHI